MQKADVRAWRARSTIDPERAFRSWYLRVVANSAKNARRSFSRRAALELRDVRRDASPIAPDPADRAVTNDERQAVIAAINGLSSGDRLVIALRHFEQLTEAEMAEVLGCALGTVKSRLSRAMERLRQHLMETEMRDVR